MPSYNHAAYIRYAIDSVLAQTFTDFELIISDDASTDGSQDIIRSYTDPRIRTVFHAKNIGLCRSYNKALEMAKGEYIAQVASDDAFLPEKLAKQVELLEKRSDIGAVFTHVQIMDEYSNIDYSHTAKQVTALQNQANRSHAEWLNYFFNQPWLSAPSQMVRASHKSQLYYDARYLRIQDLDQLQRLLVSGVRFYIIEEALTSYRFSSGNTHNLSASTWKNIRRHFFELAIVLDNYLRIDSMAQFKAIFPEQLSASGDDKLVPFHLAKQALKIGTPEHREFAIRTLFSFFAKPENIVLAETLEGYTLKDFYALTASSNLGGLQILTRVTRSKLSWLLGLMTFGYLPLIRLYIRKLSGL